MKFKMAPNSLFAVLLRSPWWISFGVALLFVVLSHLFLPEAYRVLGSLSGLPFAGIGLVAAWQQWRAPGAKKTQAIVQAVAAMSWTDFSAALERALVRDGYRVQRLPGPVGDLLLERQGRSVLVSAKRWKAARHGEEALQALHTAAESQGAGSCWYVALGELSPNAQRLASREGIQLVRGDALAVLLRDLKVAAG